MEQQQQEQPSNPIVPEVVKEDTALAKASVPVTVDDLAALEEGRGLEIIETRHKIITSLRRASIALTSPQDYLLFKTRDGAITAFLQDSGCKRIMPLWGIDITPKNGFTRIVNEEVPGEFAYECCADGFCNATQSFVKDITGVRYSIEDFCKDLAPLQKEVRVKQASIANRDGNIVRSLTGMKNVAIEEITDVWKGTDKTIEKCAKGKGFGSSRAGMENQQSDIPAPVCELCQKPMRFMAATKDYAAYWKCADYVYDREKKTGNGHSRVKDEQYRTELAKSKPPEHQLGD